MNTTPDSSPEAHAPLPGVEGPSYTPALKGLATVLLLGLGSAGVQTLQQGAWAQWDPEARVFMGLAAAAIAAGYWGIMSGRTRVDGERISQTGLWRKEVLLKDITQLKLIQVRGLNWLVVPRLVVRSGRPGFTTFQVGDPQVLAAVKRLAYG